MVMLIDGLDEYHPPLGSPAGDPLAAFMPYALPGGVSVVRASRPPRQSADPLALGAPYLHHGGERTLAELFDGPKWKQHAEAGNAVWLHQGSADDIAGRKRDLVNFLLSIDAMTAVQDVPRDFDACPANQFSGGAATLRAGPRARTASASRRRRYRRA